VEVGRTPHIRLFDCFLADTTLRSVGGGMPGMGGMDMASLMSQMGGGAGGAGGAGGSKLPETEDLYLSHHQLTSPRSPFLLPQWTLRSSWPRWVRVLAVPVVTLVTTRTRTMVKPMTRRTR
jgi:hypothetical protein